ncbi:MAG TPA: hypothetical protein VMP67_01585 [Candidatus Limnocylindria bacterium]|nr:hypothetical protein [Candidatus Limnocylindria bacterium]
MRFRSALTSVGGLLALAMLAACSEAAAPTLRPSPSPTASLPPATSAPTLRATPRPTPPPWPQGWDEAFCTAFGELTVAQELVVDIPRALADEAPEDALLLARELRTAATEGRELVTGVPEWEEALETLTALDLLADIGGRIGRQYVRFLEENRPAARARAEELSEEMGPVVEEANATLEQLASLGLDCSPYDLRLESP